MGISWIHRSELYLSQHEIFGRCICFASVMLMLSLRLMLMPFCMLEPSPLPLFMELMLTITPTTMELSPTGPLATELPTLLTQDMLLDTLDTLDSLDTDI